MEKVFEPIQINGLTLKNRLVVSAMLSNLANADGTVSDAYIAYYEAKARLRLGINHYRRLYCGPACRSRKNAGSNL